MAAYTLLVPRLDKNLIGNTGAEALGERLANNSALRILMYVDACLHVYQEPLCCNRLLLALMATALETLGL